MNTKEFKIKVLNWLKENHIDIGNKKVRVFNSKRYGLEVRIYDEPMEFQNSRKSVRKSEESSTGYFKGIFSKKISIYIHINEEDLNNDEEKEFLLQTLKLTYGQNENA
jgi:hypothetical protein